MYISEKHRLTHLSVSRGQLEQRGKCPAIFVKNANAHVQSVTPNMTLHTSILPENEAFSSGSTA